MALDQSELTIFTEATQSNSFFDYKFVSGDELSQLTETRNIPRRLLADRSVYRATIPENNWVYVMDDGKELLWLLPPEDDLVRARLQRELPLLSNEQLGQIRDVKVSIAGAGTVGANIANALVKQGVGHIKIADNDRFSAHNANRHPATIFDVGQHKVDLARRDAFKRDPYIDFKGYYDGINKDNIDEFVAEADIVISALDDIPSMLLLHQAAKKYGKPVLLCSDVDNKGLFKLYPYHTNPNYPLLDGKVSEADVAIIEADPNSPEAQRIFNQLLSQIISPLSVGAGMLEAFVQKVNGEITYIPQRNLAALITSAMAGEAVVRLATGQDLRGDTSIDLNQVFDKLGQVPNRYKSKALGIVHALMALSAQKKSRRNIENPDLLVG